MVGVILNSGVDLPRTIVLIYESQQFVLRREEVQVRLVDVHEQLCGGHSGELAERTRSVAFHVHRLGVQPHLLLRQPLQPTDLAAVAHVRAVAVAGHLLALLALNLQTTHKHPVPCHNLKYQTYTC